MMVFQTLMHSSLHLRYFDALCERGAYSHQHELTLSRQWHSDAELHLSERALFHSPGFCTEGNYTFCQSLALKYLKEHCNTTYVYINNSTHFTYGIS